MDRKLSLRFLVVWIAFGLFACSSTGTRTGPAGEAAGPLSGQKSQAVAEATRNIGEAYMAEGNLIAALRDFKKAEAINPNDHITHYDLGLVYFYRERYDLSIQHFERALQLKPDYAPALNSLGNVYAAKKEWDKAIEIYQRIIEDAFYGTPYFALSNMGLAYYYKQDYVQAEKHFLEALKLAPEFTNALAGLGTTYIATGRYAEAALRFERALKKEPKSPHLHFELGRAYQGMGDRLKAQGEFAKVIEMAPGTPLELDAQREMKSLKP
jgi:type IV pilus assembly protein PilF